MKHTPQCINTAANESFVMVLCSSRHQDCWSEYGVPLDHEEDMMDINSPEESMAGSWENDEKQMGTKDKDWYFRLEVLCRSNTWSSIMQRPLDLDGFIRFEVFTAVTMKNVVFWDIMLCGCCKNQRFGGT
jgi:hypothetical protein